MTIAATDSRTTIREIVVRQLVQVLARTPRQETPFAHVFFDQPFPSDLYAEMLAHLPELSCYSPDNPKKYGRVAKRLHGEPSRAKLLEGLFHVSSCRYTLPLNDDNLQRLPEESRGLWQGVADALASPEVKRAFFASFATALARRFRTSAAGLDQVVVYPRPTLIRDLTGYWIAPHPDTKAKVITVQFYLARDASQRDLGTALYRRHLFDPRNLISLRRHLFEKVKQFDFQPNSGYAFPVGRDTWHGREEVPDAAGERNSILLFYYLDPSRGW